MSDLDKEVVRKVAEALARQQAEEEQRARDAAERERIILKALSRRARRSSVEEGKRRYRIVKKAEREKKRISALVDGARAASAREYAAALEWLSRPEEERKSDDQDR